MPLHGLKKGKFKVNSSKLLQTLVQDYIASTNWWYTIRDIHNYLEQITGKSICKLSISKFVKLWLNKSYKRWSSRPSNYDPIRITILKRIFAIELSDIISSNQLLVNIDEVHFSKSSKTNYSWLNKESNDFRWNISFKGSLSIIWAITSSCNWFTTNLVGANNASNFVEYIKKLSKWIEEDLRIELHNTVIILDNCLIHKSRKSMEELNSRGWKVIFLAPYSPEWASIELMFNTLKRRLQRHSKNIIINLSKEEGFNNIKEWLATFSNQEIVSYWKKSIKTISSLLSIRLI